MGSDNFRVDSQILVDPASPVGDLLDSYTGVDPRFSPIGIVEDENSEHGRYFMLEYADTGDTTLEPTKVVVVNSAYDDELSASSTVVDSWAPGVLINQGSEQGMRVINISGDTPAPERTFLYYLEERPTSTVVYYVRLPDEGEALSVEAPKIVAEIDTFSRSRFYVVHIEGNLVGLYVGDSEGTRTKRTMAMVHDPVANTLTTSPYTLVEDSLPYPRSYAACKGRGDEVHIILEPSVSWREGWGSMDTSPNNLTVPPELKSSGNTWSIYSLIEGGRVIEDQLVFDGSDIQTWMGASWADASGGRHRASVIPWFMCRQTSPPSKFSSGYGIQPTEDNAFSYALTASVGTRQYVPADDLVFVQRVGEVNPTFGNHESTSSWQNSDSQAGIGSSADKAKFDLLVPGTILIEPLEAEASGTFAPVSTAGTVANRLDDWRITDDNAYAGSPNAGLYPPVPPDELNPAQNPSTDCIHGVQANVFDESFAAIVGWFTNGDPPEV